MSYRGVNEPEYMDDDEFFDPDDRDARRRNSNVLGGSGSFRDDDGIDEPPEDLGFAGRADMPGAEPLKRPKRSRSSRSPLKPRNPAPAVASSEERRARLAGKKPGSKERNSQRRQRNDAPRAQSGESQGERRPQSLRERFRRADKERPSESAGQSSRFASIRKGIGGGIGSLRQRLGRGPETGDGRDLGADATLPNGGRSGRPGAAGIGAFSSGGARDQTAPARHQPASRAPKIDSAGWLDLDRKLDLIGVALVFGAIVLFFSAISAERAAISSVNTIIGQLLGWGAFAVPVAMFAIGLWLIVRHFGDEAPTIDPVRLSGVALAFLGILVLFQFIDSLNYGEALARIAPCRNPTNSACVDALVRQSYQAGRGGGLVGGWVYSALVNNLTEPGGFVIMIMVMTFGAMLITRSSMAELTAMAIGLGRGLRTELSQYAAKQRAARLEAGQPMALAGQKSHVRVAKPRAAQLTGAEPDARALPEPRHDTMPVPQRLRGLFGLPARFSAALGRESIALEAGADGAKNSRILQRLFGKGGALAAESRPEASAGPLERFLNLGDDLPFSTAESPVWRKPPRPQREFTADAPPRPEPTPAAITPASVAPPATLPPLDPPMEKARAPFDGAGPRDEAPTPRAARTARISSVSPPESGDAPPPESKPAAESTTREPENTPELDDQAVPLDLADAGSPIDSAPSKPKAPSLPGPRPRIDWQLPDYRQLLNSGTEGELDREPLMRQAQVIEDTLASFGAPGRIVEINSGPVITQYGVEPAYLTAKTGKQNRVKVGAIAKLDKDLQLALGAKSIRVEAPVPGKGYVGIEVPNPDSARVSLRDVMESASYRKIESPLAIALGVSVDGTPVSGDLTQMPHLLIAGTTGSGKSVCVNAIINSIIAVNSPDAVKFIMIDPKRVELTGYNGMPHLVAPVVVELEGAIGVLRWVTTEMDARYKKFSQAGARNIVDFNSILDPNLAPMPYIVVIIDELADLMMMAPDDTERAITRIAALARATGIHLVIATQRPSVDVVTGLIKANCPARIAFAVAGSVDSRVILDQPGAERLLGKGDMLYLSGNSPAPMRMQGVHVSNEEISRIIAYWKRQGAGLDGVDPIPLPAPPPAQRGAVEAQNGESGASRDAGRSQGAFWDMEPAGGKKPESARADEDELYQTAVDMVRRLDKASISLLQRRLRIGYTRAARLMDMMEERGVVGPPKEGSSKPRDVLPG